MLGPSHRSATGFCTVSPLNTHRTDSFTSSNLFYSRKRAASSLQTDSSLHTDREEMSTNFC